MRTRRRNISQLPAVVSGRASCDGKRHRRGSVGENCKMLRENRVCFLPRCEPLRSSARPGPQEFAGPTGAKRAQMSEKNGGFRILGAREPLPSRQGLAKCIAEVRRRERAANGEIVEKNATARPTTGDNLLDEFWIAQVPIGRVGQAFQTDWSAQSQPGKADVRRQRAGTEQETVPICNVPERGDQSPGFSQNSRLECFTNL